MRLSKRGEAKHTNITNKRVQNTRKGAEGKSTTQTRSLRGEAHQHNKQTNVCKWRGEPRGKALHKPDVCEAKHTNITNKRVQTGEGSRREKHYTNPLFARRSTPITNKRVQTGKGAEGKSTTQTRCLRGEAHQHNK